MDTFEFKPTEGFKAGEAAGGMEAQALATATFEPTAFVEAMGEVQPAEELQVSLETMIGSVPPDVEVEAPPPAATPVTEIPVSTITEETGWKGSDDSMEWGDRSAPTVSVEIGTLPEAAIPLPIPSEGLETKRVPLAEKSEEVPLTGTAETEFKDRPERLDVRLPETQEPLTGVGTEGNVDATKGFGLEMPLDVPEIDMMPGTGLGRGGTPEVIGNMPMGGGKMEGDSGIPDLGIPDMPTSGGFHSSGSGPAILGGGGHTAEGEGDEVNYFDTDIDFDTPVPSKTSKPSKDQPPSLDDLVFWETYYAKAKNEAGCDKKASQINVLVGLRGTKSDVGLMCTTKTSDYVYDIKGYSVTKYEFPKNRQQEPDDSNPTPYLGGSMGPVLPEKDNDTGKVLPDADLGGFDGTVWKGTPDSDDSGKFYGGILGGRPESHPDSGGARPIDPKRKTEDEGEAADKAG